MQQLIESPRLTATGLKERLGTYQQHPERLKVPPPVSSEPPGVHAKLEHYGALNGHANGQGESHVIFNNVAQKYRSLCLAGIADHLEQLLSQAEANESSYLHFAESLVLHEQNQRNGKRIEQNKRRAGFPLYKSLEEFDYRFQTTISKRNDCKDAGGRATQEQLPRSTTCSTSALSTTGTTSSSSARPVSVKPTWPSASA